MRSVVYFVRDPGSGHVKIGKSKSLPARLIALRRRRPGLELLATFPGHHQTEGRFHRLLIEDHVGHEWFRPSDALLAVVRSINEGRFDAAQLPTGGNPIRIAGALRGHETRRSRLHHAVAA